MNLTDYQTRNKKIAVVGLGYVGLPLAAAFSKQYAVVGFDISPQRIAALREGKDSTRELTAEQLAGSPIDYTSDPSRLADCGVIIVTVPTPIDQYRNPDLTPLRKASATVGKHLANGAIVVYESTVYPGATEEECVPVLERESGKKWRQDFYVGYSPERINPGDKEHTVTKIKKVVSGDSPAVGAFLVELYGSIITAGIHLAPDIKTAEAAKVIENTQRDLNIALMNELSLIFDRVGIHTADVLAAAGTKWNFLPFRPGLVGGHCIGVDPYYLTWKAQSLGYAPEVILAGRRINDSMGKYVAEKLVKLMIQAGATIRGSRVLIMGLTFKENVPDIRNTKVVDIRAELLEYGIQVDVFDPLAYPEEVQHEYGFDLCTQLRGDYAGVVLAVKHQALEDTTAPESLKKYTNGVPGIVADIKGFQSMTVWQNAGYTAFQL